MVAAVVGLKGGVTTPHDGTAELINAEECSSHTRLACSTQLRSVALILLPSLAMASLNPGPG
jgi:hypothetical protein